VRRANHASKLLFSSFTLKSSFSCHVAAACYCEQTTIYSDRRSTTGVKRIADLLAQNASGGNGRSRDGHQHPHERPLAVIEFGL
jgi:hypothetical protein